MKEQLLRSSPVLESQCSVGLRNISQSVPEVESDYPVVQHVAYSLK